jgi:hypothetical protein
MVTKIIRENGGGGPEPWCGDFVAYCYRHAGSKTVQRAWAAAWSLAARFIVISPQPGDVVQYRWQHTGIFVRSLGGGSIETIEGNTGATGRGLGLNHGRRWRLPQAPLHLAGAPLRAGHPLALSTKGGTTMVPVLDALVARLPLSLQPYAKALVPAAVAAVAAVSSWLVSGAFDGAELWTALGGAVTSILVYATRNR